MKNTQTRSLSVRPGTRLGQLLKFAGQAEHGAMAREWIQTGLISVNGQLELRRGYQVADGDEIHVGPTGITLIVTIS